MTEGRLFFLVVVLALAFAGYAMTVCSSEKEPVAASVLPEEGSPAGAETGREYMKMDVEEMDLLDFIKAISDITGKDFLVSPRVTGKVRGEALRKIPVDEAYQVFQAVLEVHGFTTVPAGSIVKIVPASEARGKAVDTQQAR
ncbi:MAG: hypothetical protein SWH78_03505 [Thermodesulfobacteriota bacterium]|nr:hypothetical protein [Thermodesulfobacteriota bacterium]